MSDFYQQQVTMYMMRRAKRQATEVSTDGAESPAGDSPGQGGWLARLGSVLSEPREQPQIAPSMPEKSPKLAR